jgi:hypothetical protein
MAREHKAIADVEGLGSMSVHFLAHTHLARAASVI